MKKIILSLAILFAWQTQAQIFSDDYSNPGFWSPPIYSPPCKLIVDNISAPGKLLFKDMSKTHYQQYEPAHIYRNLSGVILNALQWRTELEYECSTEKDRDVGAILLSVSENGLHPIDLAGPNNTYYPQSGASNTYPKTDNDGIMITLADPLGNTSTTSIIVLCKVGTQISTSAPIVVQRPNASVPKYFLRLERQDATHGKISIYKDAGRTQHIQGSPVCFDIPEGMRPLDYVHHGIRHSGSKTRYMSGEIDNLKIYDELSEPPCEGVVAQCNIVANIKIEAADDSSDCMTRISAQSYGLLGTNILYPIRVDFGGGNVWPLNQGDTLYHYFPSNYYHNISITIFGFDENMNCCRKDTAIYFTPPICEDILGRTANNDNSTQPFYISSMSSNSDQVKVFPNPSKGVVTIQSEVAINKIEVNDFYGKKVLEMDSEPGGKKSITMDLSALQQGGYIILLYCNEGRTVNKLKLIQNK